MLVVFGDMEFLGGFLFFFFPYVGFVQDIFEDQLLLLFYYYYS